MVILTETVQTTRDDSAGETSVNQYRLLAEAGRGQYSRVRWVEDSAGKTFAAKIFHKSVLGRQHVAHFTKQGASTVTMQEKVNEELRLLAALDHERIIKLVEVIDAPDHEILYCVMEGCVGGPLMNWNERAFLYDLDSAEEAVRQHWGDVVTVGGASASRPQGAYMVFQENVAKVFLRQVLEGVAYLHSRNIIHKDLKPDNLLLSRPLPSADARFVRALHFETWPEVKSVMVGTAENGAATPLQRLFESHPMVAKIADFNSAAECSPEDYLIYDAQGTNQFTPPECFMGSSEGLDGRLRDAWSIGCVLFCMLFGRCPYWASDNLSLQFQIIGEEYCLPAGIATQDAENLIKALLHKDVDERSTIDAALTSAWLRA
eukprot:TRINITY_DN31638_c0_g1_i1.p1 TRINITY_DN31638_c0_g1~~TRINITY_DN31638_c0_g1_i1.p1  ORF type:complete len:375 (+),score=64.04 TRINITY_DN31638_c0_g1_i1:82-1206(+)